MRPGATRSGARSRFRARALCIGAVLLAGCSVGPEFARPASPATAQYLAPTAAPDLAPGEEPSQHLAPAQSIPAQWWQMFHSERLDALVRQAIAGSPTLDAARATLAQAQQAVAVARGGLFPQVDFAAAAERQKGPAFALALLPQARQGLPVFNLYSLGPTVSYSPDVFGLNARRVEQQQALAQGQGYQLAAAYLAITGNSVAEALAMATSRRQIEAIRAIIADDQRNLALVRDRFAAGRIDRNDVLTAEAQLSNDRAQLPPLEQQLAVAEDALAILVGRPPAQWRAPEFDLTEFTLPADLPLSLPSALVRQRPDILAAEAQLHAASAAIGVATAQMYPNFPLSASIDTAALATTSLFEQSSLVWTLAGGLTAPVFHGGALKAQRRAAVAGFQASLAIYRQTVLQAFGQVADTLRALGHDAQLAEDERHALQAAREALELQQVRYAAGRSDVLHLIDAERSVQQASLGYARAQAQRYLDSAELIVAMGGGWWRDRAACSACGTGTVAAGEADGKGEQP